MLKIEQLSLSLRTNPLSHTFRMVKTSLSSLMWREKGH